MPKYPSVTCTLPEFAAWVRWWCGQEEQRLLAANRAADPKQIRQSMGLLSDAMGRWLTTAEDFAKVCCKACDATGMRKSSIVVRPGTPVPKLPCPACEGRGFLSTEKPHGTQSPSRPKLRLAGPDTDPDADDEPQAD